MIFNFVWLPIRADFSGGKGVMYHGRKKFISPRASYFYKELKNPRRRLGQLLAGKWRRYLPRLKISAQSLSGRMERCPICKAPSSFFFRECNKGCFGNCIACQFRGNGFALVLAANKFPDEQRYWEWIAEYLGLKESDPPIFHQYHWKRPRRRG